MARRQITVSREQQGYCSGLTDALRRLWNAESRPPTDDDRPPVSTFPMTPAAREALRLSRLRERVAA